MINICYNKKKVPFIKLFMNTRHLSNAYMHYLMNPQNNPLEDKHLLFLILYMRSLGLRRVRWLRQAGYQ